MKIGFIGLGRMGYAMAQRLTTQGISKLNVWDRDTVRVQKCLSLGCLAQDNAADVVRASEITLVMINDDAGAQELYLDHSGIVSGCTPGRLVIEMSTLQPQTLERMSMIVEERGAHMIGAPMMGSIPTV